MVFHCFLPSFTSLLEWQWQAAVFLGAPTVLKSNKLACITEDAASTQSLQPSNAPSLCMLCINGWTNSTNNIAHIVMKPKPWPNLHPKPTRASKLTLVDGVLPCFCSFPTCQVGVAIFFLPFPLSSPRCRNSYNLRSVFGPSIAISYAHCSLPDPNGGDLRSVFASRPQLRSTAPSVPCQTSTSRQNVRRDARKNVRQSGKMWERMSNRMSHRPKRMSEEMLERTPQRLLEEAPGRKFQKECHKKCQRVCQKECQKICQTKTIVTSTSIRAGNG